MKKDDLLAYFNRPTHYEIANGLEPQEQWKLDRAFGDMEFYTRVSGNKSKTLLIIYKPAPVTKPDDWYAWMITDPQAKVLIEEFPEFYRELNNKNYQARTAGQPQDASPEDFWPQGEGGVEY